MIQFIDDRMYKILWGKVEVVKMIRAQRYWILNQELGKR